MSPDGGGCTQTSRLSIFTVGGIDVMKEFRYFCGFLIWQFGLSLAGTIGGGILMFFYVIASLVVLGTISDLCDVEKQRYEDWKRSLPVLVGPPPPRLYPHEVHAHHIEPPYH